LLTAALCARTSSSVAQLPASVEPFAIVGVSTIDPTQSAARRDDQTILIENGRIAAIGPRASVTVPRNARRIDGAGRFVIPGLWDSHVHFMNAGVTALPVLLAHGVTTVREMGGFLDSTRVWQRRMREGTLQGPRIITPGPILESPQYLQGVRDRSARLEGRLAPRVLPYRVGIATADDARRVIDSLVGLRVDFVKIRTVASPEVYYAILREAHRARLRIAGHSPGVVPSHIAADSGQDDIEHALVLFTPADRALRAQSFVAHKTWYTPTLVVTQAGTFSGDSANTFIFGPRAMDVDARRGYASPWLLGWWRMQVDERMADTSSTNPANARRIFQGSLEDVRAFHAAGVRILAGTDAGSVLVYPGPSLHEELALLVEAGLTPRDALWSATAGPSQFAGLDSSVGRLAVGQVADLVLLDADPLTDISNTRRIRAVVQAGRLFDRAALDAMLAQVRSENSAK
jgi:imidazolonepropionase-like amidohydrolase